MLTVPLSAGTGSRRLVLIHGFTQSGRFWDSHVRALSDGFEIFAPDLPGHGQAPPEHDNADLWQAAELVSEIGGPATYVGYSLGARVALHVALLRPKLVEGLVLFGAKGGIEDPQLRTDRRRADETTARNIERDGVERFVDEWLAQPFNQRLADSAQRRTDRLKSRAAGLAASLRHCGTGAQEPLWDRLCDISAPVSVVHGAEDLSAVVNDARRIVATIGANASLAVISNSGHAVPFEQPAAAVDLLRSFSR